jgi:hypothetical protein
VYVHPRGTQKLIERTRKEKYTCCIYFTKCNEQKLKQKFRKQEVEKHTEVKARIDATKRSAKGTSYKIRVRDSGNEKEKQRQSENWKKQNMTRQH